MLWFAPPAWPPPRAAPLYPEGPIPLLGFAYRHPDPSYVLEQPGRPQCRFRFRLRLGDHGDQAMSARPLNRNHVSFWRIWEVVPGDTSRPTTSEPMSMHSWELSARRVPSPFAQLCVGHRGRFEPSEYRAEFAHHHILIRHFVPLVAASLPVPTHLPATPSNMSQTGQHRFLGGGPAKIIPSYWLHISKPACRLCWGALLFSNDREQSTTLRHRSPCSKARSRLPTTSCCCHTARPHCVREVPILSLDNEQAATCTTCSEAPDAAGSLLESAVHACPGFDDRGKWGASNGAHGFRPCDSRRRPGNCIARWSAANRPRMARGPDAAMFKPPTTPASTILL